MNDLSVRTIMAGFDRPLRLPELSKVRGKCFFNYF